MIIYIIFRYINLFLAFFFYLIWPWILKLITTSCVTVIFIITFLYVWVFFSLFALHLRKQRELLRAKKAFSRQKYWLFFLRCCVPEMYFFIFSCTLVKLKTELKRVSKSQLINTNTLPPHWVINSLGSLNSQTHHTHLLLIWSHTHGQCADDAAVYEKWKIRRLRGRSWKKKACDLNGRDCV